MSERIECSDSRLLLCKLQLFIHRNAAAVVFNTDRFGAVATESILSAAILVGQLEDRPMTAAKLAVYTGIPRPTVVRKLRFMQAIGLVEMAEGGAATIAIARANDPHMIDLHERIVAEVRRFVSKMDTMAVASDAPI